MDDRKNASNLKKHGVRSETAARVFIDPWFVMEEDHAIASETRWRTIGEINGEMLLLLIHLFREDDDEQETVPIISAREATPKRGHVMRVVNTLEPGTPLTEEQRAELRALKDRPIDFSDIPELPPDAFKNAVRGKFYRPVKQPVSLRLDADVLAWLKKDGDGYQTRVNQMLRERMLADLNKA